jgi:DTW domain-containing protein YfiP
MRVERGAPAPQQRAPRAYCRRCDKAQVACLCAVVSPVANRTGLTILQHPRERSHALGTVRIARLGLRHLHVERCAPWEDSSAIRARVPAGAALLYPAPSARPLDELPRGQRPHHLVVLDGTWFHAKKIYDAHQWLRELPQVCLLPQRPSGYRIRREPRRHCLATLEAIVEALRILEPRTRGGDALLAAFATMIDWQESHMPGPATTASAADTRAAT